MGLPRGSASSGTHLEELARITGDSVALCVLDGTEIVYVARASIRTILRLEAMWEAAFPPMPPPRAVHCSRA